MSNHFFFSSLGLAVILIVLSAVFKSKLAFVATSAYVFFLSLIVGYFGFGAALRKSAASLELTYDEYQLFFAGIKALDNQLLTVKIWIVTAFGLLFVCSILQFFISRRARG